MISTGSGVTLSILCPTLRPSSDDNSDVSGRILDLSAHRRDRCRRFYSHCTVQEVPGCSRHQVRPPSPPWSTGVLLLGSGFAYLKVSRVEGLFSPIDGRLRLFSIAKTLTKWVAEYGPVVSVRAGSQVVVVLGSVEVCQSPCVYFPKTSPNPGNPLLCIRLPQSSWKRKARRSSTGHVQLQLEKLYPGICASY